MTATPIKFGTDGWRAIIADDYTVDNVRRVAAATAKWALKQPEGANRLVVVGHDCRFGGQLFSETTAAVLADYGLKVVMAKDFVSTPMISLAAKQHNAVCGVIITASHNPPSYNGYKLKGAYGGPALPETISEVEALLPDSYTPKATFDSYVEEGKITYADFEEDYVRHAEQQFDLEAIRKAGLRIAYDAMYGSGFRAVERLLPQSFRMHSELNPGFNGQAPEPIAKNLQPFVDAIRADGKFDFGFATDGDADRIGVFDKDGNFIDSHHLILLLINYLHKVKGYKGKVVNSFSCTSRIGDLCNQLGLGQIVTKIGFKYICGYIIEEPYIVGGEESGGIAVAGHIPERDGVWIALTLLEYMAKTGKTLNQLIEEVYAMVGSFAVERYDLHITEEQKQQIIKACQNREYVRFGQFDVQNVEDLDGWKFHLKQGGWVMIRPSGTEPVLRVYAEAENYGSAISILDATKAAILN